MPRRSDIAQAFERLSKYAARDEWREHRRAHLERMLGRVLEHYSLDLEACFEELSELGHIETLIGFLDEAFLAVSHGEDKSNVIDDYLKRRGWQETPRAREYLQGIRANGTSLYEVHDVAPGEWIELKDLYRGGPPQRIAEKSGSRSLQRWDRLVARVVTARGEAMLTGAVLPLTHDSAEAIEGILSRARDKGRAAAEKLARKHGVTLELVVDMDETLLRVGDAVFLQCWLKGLLDFRRRPLPSLANTDGEALLLSRTRLPVDRANEDEIVCRLDAMAGWEREQEDTRAWLWQPGTDTPRTILGNARLEAQALVVEANSRERMDRALAELRSTLGPLVGEALTSYEDPTQLLRNAAPAHGAGSLVESNPVEPGLTGPEVEAAVRQFMDAHYRRTLDEPVPMLGDKTPRECARTKAGRARVVRWLKDMENNERRRAAATGETPYDFAWIWDELGLAEKS